MAAVNRERLAPQLALVRRSSMSERDKDILQSFADDCLVRGLSDMRVGKLLWQLRRISTWLGRGFEEAQPDDIKRLALVIHREELADWTKADYREVLRQFYRWLERDDLVHWLRVRRPRGNAKMPETLLTEQDIHRMMQAAHHPRDRAIVSFMWESGARIGEVMGLALKDIAFDARGAQVRVDGKTGPRRIRVVSSVPHLSTWLQRHPGRQDANAAVWVSQQNAAKKMDYERVRHLLRHLRDQAGIQKPVNPHHFRHSRASFLANHLTESQLKEYLGWVQDSGMAAVYVHLSGRDLDDAILRVNQAMPAQAVPMHAAEVEAQNLASGAVEEAEALLDALLARPAFQAAVARRVQARSSASDDSPADYAAYLGAVEPGKAGRLRFAPGEDRDASVLQLHRAARAAGVTLSIRETEDALLFWPSR